MRVVFCLFLPGFSLGRRSERREKEAKAEAKRATAEATKRAKREAQKQIPAAAKRMSSKNDPALAALARELRDRWMAEVERDPAMLSLPARTDANTYDVSRQLQAHSPGSSQREGRKQVTNFTRLAA